ncbi:sel1 repeat family protein [Campylobacter sp. 19-13652]|uniref:sel1 repeat family protein n=1 Tax=Campylobacter sp. 19-13652 TaxID=2840180 RepID=UPI001C75C5EC|nr:sel1 repeat family protein [Campylobacter sp. 19-13652]BCX79141.1 hypothetical protein LBC_06030 [Campylobacter sp. 19-13652]
MKKIVAFFMAGLAGALLASDLSVTKGSYEYAYGLYKHGKFDEAYADFSSLCKNGSDKSCSMKAIMDFNGEGVVANKEAAINEFKSLCDKNEAMACGKLGELYTYGYDRKNVKLEQIEAVLKKACEGGYAPSCDLAK